MKISKEKLSEIRKKELARKEFENEIARDLKLSEEKEEAQKALLKEKNPYLIGCINFFGTLILAYTVYFLGVFFLGRIGALGLLESVFGYINVIIQLGIWIMAAVSLYRKKSVLEDIVDYFY